MRTCAITCLLSFLSFRGLRRGAGGGGGESEDEVMDMMSILSGFQSSPGGGPLLPVREGRNKGVLDMRRVGARDSEDMERLEAPGGWLCLSHRKMGVQTDIPVIGSGPDRDVGCGSQRTTTNPTRLDA